MPGTPSANSKPNLTDEERNGVVQYLLTQYDGSKINKGAINAAASKFKVSRQTISSIWKEAKMQMQSDTVAIDVSSKIQQNSGRKKER